MWFFLLSQRMQVNDTYLNAGFCPSLLCNLTNGSRARPRVTAAAGPRRYESATVWPGKSRDGVTAGGSRERSRYARPSYCRCDGRGGGGGGGGRKWTRGRGKDGERGNQNVGGKIQAENS